MEAAPSATWSTDQVLAELIRFRSSPEGRWLSADAYAVLRALLVSGVVAVSGRWRTAHVADALSAPTLGALAVDPDLGPDHLRALPRALDAWTRYCHAGLDPHEPAATLELLELLHGWGAEWAHRVDQLGGHRGAGPTGHLRRQLAELAAAVGGEEVLLVLQAEPLTDDPVDTTGLAPEVARLLVAAVDCCDQHLAPTALVELRVVCRRLLERVARRSPSLVLQRRTGALAAAAMYAAVHGNRLKVSRPSLFQTSRIAGATGVSASSVPAWARELLAAAGATGASAHPAGTGHPSSGTAGRPPLHLGDPDLLISHCRRWILDDAARLRARLAEAAHPA